MACGTRLDGFMIMAVGAADSLPLRVFPSYTEACTWCAAMTCDGQPLGMLEDMIDDTSSVLDGYIGPLTNLTLIEIFQGGMLRSEIVVSFGESDDNEFDDYDPLSEN